MDGIYKIVEIFKMGKSLFDQLQDAIKDEDAASLMYIKLAEEVEKRGLHRSSLALERIAVDEKRHKDTLLEIVEELKTVVGLVGAAAPEPGIYWWVRLGESGTYETFNTVGEALQYVEKRTGQYFSAARWINDYGFELGPFKGRNYITFFEGNEHGVPTERHLRGKFS